MTLWFCHQNKSGYGKDLSRINLDLNPCPTILAGGIHGDNTSHYWLEEDGKQNMTQSKDKPPYKVPSMPEIAAIEWNGLKVASTFSGTGGSCLGYRMAGYRVVWANEFIPIAQESYRANFPDTHLDTRDIKKVTAVDILSATGLEVGELDLFDGSPPCQAFSSAGKREKGWGKGKTYDNGIKQNNEELFSEYIRLLDGLKPKVFIAENVSGLVKGTAKGYFIEILKALKACGYNVEAKLLDAQWLGVPQARQRIIFVGVRNDLGLSPVFPKPLPYRYSVRDALPHIIRQGDNGGFGKGEMRDSDLPSPTIGTSTQAGNVRFPPSLVEAVIHDTGNFASCVPITDKPCPSITIGVKGSNSCHYLVAGQGNGDTETGRQPDGIERRKFTIAELKRICAFPDDFNLISSYSQKWERLGNSVPPVMMYHIATTIYEGIFSKLPIVT